MLILHLVFENIGVALLGHYGKGFGNILRNVRLVSFRFFPPTEQEVIQEVLFNRYIRQYA